MKPTIPGEVDETSNEIEAIIDRVKSGDKQAYEMIICQFERQMYTYCYYILKNHEETEDAVQEIFIRAYENLHRYSRQATFSAWLYKMAYHHMMNIKKKQGRRLKLIHEFKEQQAKIEISPRESVIEELLTYLTPEERHILLLKAVEQYSFDEIGDVMGIKPATVRKKYERLRLKLSEYKRNKGGIAHGTFAKSN
ncbi:RNA polymerase sigma factor [Paenibacillus sp. IHBB 10380]|uniref:RNA polymerase sigma factor n=1 Tax=Paenibacillus sp. IHBB 10380 TaxID=1566358 RepID=UPI0005CFB283|nr:sigma-70 family RNA polymerase sigma factor [Paenibacillus sp. IHBB 10380]AJS60651.1 DNA-directed RNA polymerase subunit sigma [Paenibacillus sp. IHBB 10380]